ncbi:ABC transporter ATP-binding protein [Actibacterium lipolyticum]|uniref:Putative siderophore transport system ATP-binding protein YusV n=1 Tax=Actibacterium lipolyticum TaxID=1524263 RepID=A0A238L7T1_9RHOB|nr:ABC transporter ATP-binding protein [Actibacterium lipolyticum]SMX51067.1 putative siderophore transport system ATP-binding protein YusV [Actibacterium lipolyticum]
MLDVNEVTVSYGATPVLDGVSARFKAGRFTAIAGPNGCGKSTLLSAVMGLIPVDGGIVNLDGTPIHTLPRRTLARRAAYLPQENHCPDYMTVGEVIELAGHARYGLMGGPSDDDRSLFQDALKAVGLEDMAHRRMSVLSGGQRQRAWIAMLLAQDAPCILMDEPVNHIDMTHQYAVLSLMSDLARQQGRTVICVLHDLNLAATFADDIVLMRDGRVSASGPVDETITPDNVARVFGMQADIFTRNGRLVCLPDSAPAQP